jgi:hypothetical protein
MYQTSASIGHLLGSIFYACNAWKRFGSNERAVITFFIIQLELCSFVDSLIEILRELLVSHRVALTLNVLLILRIKFSCLQNDGSPCLTEVLLYHIYYF